MMIRSLAFASLVLVGSSVFAQAGGNCRWEVKNGRWVLVHFAKECPDCFNGSGCMPPSMRPWPGGWAETPCVGKNAGVPLEGPAIAEKTATVEFAQSSLRASAYLAATVGSVVFLCLASANLMKRYL